MPAVAAAIHHTGAPAMGGSAAKAPTKAISEARKKVMLLAAPKAIPRRCRANPGRTNSATKAKIAQATTTGRPVVNKVEAAAHTDAPAASVSAASGAAIGIPGTSC